MRLAALRIERFRGILIGEVRFQRHTVLVGPNNCGKTTIIEALALLFGRDRLVRELTEHDFYGGTPLPADRIRLVATVTDFEGDDATHHPEWFRDDRGVPKWFNEDSGNLGAKRLDPQWRLACQVGFMARFDRPSLEVETVRYFHDDDAQIDVFDEATTAQLPSKLLRDVGLFLVPASRTWDRIISFGSELFRRVVNSADGPPSDSVIDTRDRLRSPEQPMENDATLKKIVDELNTELGGFFTASPKLQLRLTSTDSRSVLEAVVPHYIHSSTSAHSLPARRHGSGLVSLQGLLLLMQFGRRRAEAGEGFWMAVEEPELHVPPPLQRRLVNRLQALSTQTFVTTHSPMLAALADPRSVQIVRNSGGSLVATPLLNEALPTDATSSVRKLFQYNRAETIAALMHEATLIPEGRHDLDLLRTVLQAVDAGQSWDSEESRFPTHVGLVPTHDAAVVDTYKRIASLHPRANVLVDGDAAGKDYAATLATLEHPPPLVLRWPDGWEIEDVVGWIVRDDEKAVLASINNTLGCSLPSIDALVAQLKSKDRKADGRKGDYVSYEAIGVAIADSKEATKSARSLMNALCAEVLGEHTTLFAPEFAQGNHVLKVFLP